jgi:hypothetical protein
MLLWWKKVLVSSKAKLVTSSREALRSLLIQNDLLANKYVFIFKKS